MKTHLQKLIPLLIIGLSPMVTSAATPPPVETVQRLQDSLIHSMKQGGAAGYDARFLALEPVIAETYAFDTIASIILRRHWADLTQHQRDTFIDTLETLAVANFASKFDNYTGESFGTTRENELKAGQFVVETQLSRPGKDSVEFKFVVANLDGGWRVLSTIVDGVNDLAVKRAEYSSVIERDGFDALIRQIREKIQGYGGVPETTARTRTAGQPS